MDARKQCPRCGRAIDSSARLCPFCNQEQVIETLEGDWRELSDGSPSKRERRAAGASRATPLRQVLSVLAGLGLLVGMFFVGWLVYALGQPEASTDDGPAAAGKPADSRRTPDLTLVADGSGIPDIERAYTSRLAEKINRDLPEEFQRRDATALPFAVYERVAAQEKQREESKQIVDPRDVTRSVRPIRRPTIPDAKELPTERRLGEIPGSAAESPQPPTTSHAPALAEAANDSPSTTEPERLAPTRPRPIHQPVPRIVSRVPGSVRVNLAIGTDGLVTSVRVVQGLPGVTPQVINAVNRWRFQPATVNGQPVESTYEVEIVVKPNR